MQKCLCAYPSPLQLCVDLNDPVSKMMTQLAETYECDDYCISLSNSGRELATHPFDKVLAHHAAVASHQLQKVAELNIPFRPPNILLMSLFKPDPLNFHVSEAAPVEVRLLMGFVYCCVSF